MYVIVYSDKDYYCWLWLTNDRPDLSSERAPHMARTVTFNQNKYMVMIPRRGSTPRQTDWLSVVKWLWLWQLMLILASAVISGPSPAGLRIIFYCLRFETFPTWRARSSYLYSRETEWSSYTPIHWVPFLSPPTTRRYSNPPPLGVQQQFKDKVKVTLRLAVYRKSFRLGAKPRETHDKGFFFSIEPLRS
jgi:hypothetical protein